MPNRIFADTGTKGEVWIGDLQDAITHGGHFDPIICVLEGCAYEAKNVHPQASRRTNHFAVLDYAADNPDPRRALPKELDRVAEFIHIHRAAGKRILVHCGAGIERSPFTVTWYLMRKQHMRWNDAFSLVQRQRPQAQDRAYWFEDVSVPDSVAELLPHRNLSRR